MRAATSTAGWMTEAEETHAPLAASAGRGAGVSLLVLRLIQCRVCDLVPSQRPQCHSHSIQVERRVRIGDHQPIEREGEVGEVHGGKRSVVRGVVVVGGPLIRGELRLIRLVVDVVCGIVGISKCDVRRAFVG